MSNVNPLRMWSASTIAAFQARYPTENLALFEAGVPEVWGNDITFAATEQDWILARYTVTRSTVVYMPWDDVMCMHGVASTLCLGCRERVA